MKTIEDIRDLIDQGMRKEAIEELDNLLELGPNNIEGLRLKCVLLAQEGRLPEERMIWEKIISIDPENIEAQCYFDLQYLEEKEQYFFTSNLAGGGRKFLIRPKEIIDAAILGLLGCLAFLATTNSSFGYYLVGSTLLSTLSFLLFIIIPWVYIIVQFFRMPLELCTTPHGVGIISRTKAYFLYWKDIANIHIANQIEKNNFSLAIIFVPKDPNKKAIEIDISRESSSITAKSLFIQEIIYYFGMIHFSKRKKLKLEKQNILSI